MIIDDMKINSPLLCYNWRTALTVPIVQQYLNLALKNYARHTIFLIVIITTILFVLK